MYCDCKRVAPFLPSRRSSKYIEPEKQGCNESSDRNTAPAVFGFICLVQVPLFKSWMRGALKANNACTVDENLAEVKEARVASGKQMTRDMDVGAHVMWQGELKVTVAS